MKKIAGIGKKIMTGVFYLAALVTMLTNGLLVYLVLAPDSLPKPFYLSYQYPSGEVSSGAPAVSNEDTPVSHESEQSISEQVVSTTINPEVLSPGQGVTVDTGVMIINLADPGGRRYIKINIVLEFAPTDPEYYALMDEELHGTAEEEASGSHGGEEETVSPFETYVNEFKTQISNVLFAINDSLITLISSKSYEEINTVEGKEALRQEVAELVNNRLPNYHVIQVYFTEFVVQ